MSLLAGRLAVPFHGAYASTFALEAFSDALRAELEPWAIEVVLVKADAVGTPIWCKIATEIGAAATEWQSRCSEVLERYRDMAERAGARVGVLAARVADAIAWALTAPRRRSRLVVAAGPGAGGCNHYRLAER